MTTISFLDSLKPMLQEGTYTVNSTVTVEKPNPEVYQRSSILKFKIGGDVARLSSPDIVAMFPPDGSLGEYTETMPHIMLTDPYLPYARVVEKLTSAPWLALLLVTDADLGAGNVLKAEPFNNNGVPIERVTIASELLLSIAPYAEDLPLLTHVRQLGDDAATRTAVIMCSRLPSKESRNTVLLISLLGLYQDGTAIISGNGGEITLDVIARWSFSCIDPNDSFESRMSSALNSAKPLLGIEPSPPPPPSGDPGKLLRLGGWSLLPFHQRDGGESFGVYRGPFVAVEPPVREVPSALFSSDGLLEFMEHYALFDLSYAAAWELGRLMALSSAATVKAIVSAQRDTARVTTQAQAGANGLWRRSVSPASSQATAATIPSAVSAMLERLCALSDVPFVYLVPDPGMLPRESVRFFYLDAHWIRCLMAGAISAGLLPGSGGTIAQLPPVWANFGVLIRSSVVADFPSLEVNGYLEETTSVTTSVGATSVRLSPQVLLILFEKPVKQVDFSLHATSLHYGFQKDDSNSNKPHIQSGKGVALDKTSYYRQGGYGSSKCILNVREIAKALTGSTTPPSRELARSLLLPPSNFCVSITLPS